MKCIISFSCQLKGAAPVECNIGTYSIGGVLECSMCTVGHYCPSKSISIPYPCPTGWYATVQGLDKCIQCPRGKF